MPQYKLKLLNDAGDALGEIECFATNPWLALEKSSKTIGRNMVEVYDGERTFGRFRTAFPMTQVWEVSPALRRETKA